MVSCPTPDKNPYATDADAVANAAAAIRKRGGYLRIYRCPCGAWHLTHKRRQTA